MLIGGGFEIVNIDATVIIEQPKIGPQRAAICERIAGALGIEALSCGAKFCLFVDDDAESRALVRENVETMKLTGVSKIWRRDAADLGPLGSGSGGPFNLAFIDPPYRKRLADKCLASLKAGGWLAPGAIVVVETAADETLDHAGYELLDTRAYGETSVRLLSPAE